MPSQLRSRTPSSRRAKPSRRSQPSGAVRGQSLDRDTKLALRCGAEVHTKVRVLVRRYSRSTVVETMMAYTAALLYSLVRERVVSRRDGVAFCREFTSQALSGQSATRRMSRGRMGSDNGTRRKRDVG